MGIIVELFDVKYYRDLELWVRCHSRSLKSGKGDSVLPNEEGGKYPDAHGSPLVSLRHSGLPAKIWLKAYALEAVLCLYRICDGGLTCNSLTN